MNELLAGIDVVGEAGRVGLVLLRVGSLTAFCPILGSELVPARIRGLMGVAFAVALLPVVPPPAALPAGVGAWTLAVLRELSVGLALGMAARAVFTGIEAAAGLVAGQTGFSLASMVDPLTGDQGIAPAMFQTLLATALFLAADLHHLFFRALLRSYEVLPAVPAPPSVSGMADTVAFLGLRLFGIAVELAAPALVVTFAVDLVMVLVGRAAPQVPMLVVGYPAKMAAGLVAMAILASATGAAIGWIGKTFASDGARLLSIMAGG